MTHQLPFLALTFVRSALFEILFFIWGFVASVVACGLSYLPDRKPLVEWSALWAHGVTFLERTVLGLNYVMLGKENFPPAPFIAALQHQSAWETPKLLYWFKDSAVVMKAELGAIPVWGRAAKRYGSIFVARSRTLDDLRQFIASAKQRINDKRNIILFPQGTRTPPGAAIPLQKGFTVLYKELGIPIVPVTLDSGKFWAKKSFLKFPGTVTVRVHPPILPGLSRDELMETLRRLFESPSTPRA